MIDKAIISGIYISESNPGTKAGRLAKRLLPETALDCIRDFLAWLRRGNIVLLWSVLYDFRRYRRWSAATSGANSAPKLQANIVKAYHSLEKGLALPNPRPGFGQPAALGVIAACEQHLTRYGLAQPVLDAVGALKEYCRFQHAAGADLWKVWDRLEGLENAVSAEAGKVRGGTTVLTTEAIRDATQGISADFFSTRHSVRQFTDEPIDRALIDEALMRAQRTPSVCNRHCARVHVLTGAAAKARALSFQNGNRGFGHQASVVFIVTADLSAFMDAGERFQGWIDGGMYAMSLVYSLHSLGLGSCTLNWSVTPGRDRKLRAAMNVPGNELVIMMIAAGHIPDSLKVASSPRPPIEATTRYLGDRASDQPPHVQSLPS